MPNYHTLKATPETVKWGYFDNSQKPVLTIKPGDIVEMETITHHAGDAPDLLMDDGVRAIYDAIPEAERAPGVHIITGPIHVEGAQPGDVLEVKVLDMKPRLEYGISFGANWGLLYEDFQRKEHVTIYKIDRKSGLVQAISSYPYWTLCDKPGRITEPGKTPRTPCLKNIFAPAALHFGTAGVAPRETGKVDTIPPGPFGGNMDNRSFVSGTSMLYPVQVKGALFAAGDAHFAQGDGEISGTAIEAHVNATLQFSINKTVKLIENPVLSSSAKWMVHGFDADLDQAVRKCALEAIAFLGANYGLNKEEAYSLLSVAGDFHITQVVDGKKGVHCSIRKNMFIPA